MKHHSGDIPALPRATHALSDWSQAAIRGCGKPFTIWRGIASVLALLLCSCASLPSPRELATQREQVRISTESGWMSYDKSAQIVERLDRESDSQGFLERHLAVEEAVSGAPLVAGNRVELLVDGPSTYEAMQASIAAARTYIHMETYIFDDDQTGNLFADALISKRQAGVAVSVMVDAVGTLTTPPAIFSRMREAGIQVLVFNPLNPLAGKTGWSPNERNHRKLLVVDGRVGYLGGLNVSDVYSSSSGSGSTPAKADRSEGAKADHSRQGKADNSTQGKADRTEAAWRDTHVQIRGPAVAEIEKVFEDGWRKQDGPALLARDSVPEATRQGPLIVRIVTTRPDEAGGQDLYLTMLSAFRSAQRSISITMAYFVPDPAFLAALEEAAQRKVRVRLILPGFSDSSLVFHAGRSHYTSLLESGVQIYERRDALLHAKTAVVDGVWSTVGSSNMDWRSFALNHELNAVILGSSFASQMEALFERDLDNSEPVRIERWRERPLSDRFMEVFSRFFERSL